MEIRIRYFVSHILILTDTREYQPATTISNEQKIKKKKKKNVSK